MRSFSISLFGTLLCVSFSVSLGLAPAALADVHLPAIESDNMVLQAGAGPQLYGSAAPGEDIAIKYGHRQASTKTDNFGQWRVRLPHLKAGEKFDIEIKGKNTLDIKNVLVGEVWLCSGQSNMEFPLARANDHAKEIAQANHDQLRLFKVERRLATAPAADVQGSWKVCNPAAAADFSAVGYFFGRALSQDLKTPVGLIESSWGGTPAQVWTSLDGLEADPVTQKRYWVMAKEHLAKLHQMSETYDKEMADWKLSADKIAAEKSQLPAPPAKPSELEFPHAPSMLYNAMIAPLTAYTIGGVIWYQGESNANAADETMAYRHLFPALINDWRQKFGLPKLPFLYVQLANYEKREDANVRSPWAELREAQLLTLKVPNTGMAVAVDIGDEKDIHPKNKLDVGLRLERIALAEVYGRKVAFSGPIFSGMTVKGNQAICTFKYTDHGLKAKGGKLVGFTICGADKKFVAADAEIVGNTVHVSSASVALPTAVRYAWAGDPLNNLYNGADFPASPFRSDVTPEPAVVDLPVTK
ncbi:MAG: sialate O-acetylesterase [Cyanobacteria bacterium REEB67]|nr:sialate O-acetylesterase [Cyanobacteria bacterium REEB67]